MIPSTPAELLCESLYATAYGLRETEPYRASPMFHLIAKLAPTDERGWLGVGLCHEDLGDLDAALSMYTFGQGAARSVRCIIARARVLRKLDREDDGADVLDHALTLEWSDDDDVDLLETERRRFR